MAHGFKFPDHEFRFPNNKFRFPHQAKESSAKPYGALSFQPSPISHSSSSGNYIADTQARMPQSSTQECLDHLLKDFLMFPFTIQ